DSIACGDILAKVEPMALRGRRRGLSRPRSGGILEMMFHVERTKTRPRLSPSASTRKCPCWMPAYTTFTDTGRGETTLITVVDQPITVSDIAVAVDSAGGQAPNRPDPRPGSGVVLLSEMAARALEAVFNHQVATRFNRPFTSRASPTRHEPDAQSGEPA